MADKQMQVFEALFQIWPEPHVGITGGVGTIGTSVALLITVALVAFVVALIIAFVETLADTIEVVTFVEVTF